MEVQAAKYRIGFGRLNGQTVGVVANQRNPRRLPRHRCVIKQPDLLDFVMRLTYR